MNYNKLTVEDIDVNGKKILLRCDFNVPRDKNNGISDSKRITASLPTIKYLLDHNAAVILCSHMGRPKGEYRPELSLGPVARHIESALGVRVKMSRDVIGADSFDLAKHLKPGECMLLENLRFHEEEEKNDHEFAKLLASMADVYVSDAFGCCHRAHASTVGVADYMPAVSGFLLARELEILGSALENPQRPFVAILGGSKVSDKIGVINNLLDRADTLIIGGAMAYTFIKAQGGSIGKSLCQDDELDYAREMVKRASWLGIKLLLPEDTVVAESFSESADAVFVDTDKIPDGMIGMDIGPKAVEAFKREIAAAGTVLWNGPMGVFEFENFSEGTRQIAMAMAGCGGITIVGGGDSAAAADQYEVADKMTHVSTGGGASLEFLEGIELPGVTCLMDRDDPGGKSASLGVDAREEAMAP